MQQVSYISLLPAEIIFEIVELLFSMYKEDRGNRKEPKVKLSSYACVSRQFQHAIERKIFASIQVHSPSFGEFYKVFMWNPHRKGFLRSLELVFDIPDFVSRFPDEDQRVRDKREKWDNLHFSKVVWDILRKLHWLDFPVSPGISLTIAPVTSLWHRRFVNRQYNRCIDRKGEIELGAFGYHLQYPCLLKLDLPRITPVIPAITSLRVIRRERGYRYLDLSPSAAMQLARKFPNVSRLYTELFDTREVDNSVRIARRNEAASQLSWFPQTFSRLRSFELNYASTAPYFHHYILKSVVEEGGHPDRLSVALGKLFETKLEELFLQGPFAFSLDLFKSLRENLTSNLKTLEIEVPIVDAEGNWLAEGDGSSYCEKKANRHLELKDYDSEDEAANRPDRHQLRRLGDYPRRIFRTNPVISKWEEIIREIASILPRMPQLKKLVFACFLPELGRSNFQVLVLQLLSPGSSCKYWTERESLTKAERFYCKTVDVETCEHLTSQWFEHSGRDPDTIIVRHLAPTMWVVEQ